jgi:hypothetical protein
MSIAYREGDQVTVQRLGRKYFPTWQMRAPWESASGHGFPGDIGGVFDSDRRERISQDLLSQLMVPLNFEQRGAGVDLQLGDRYATMVRQRGLRTIDQLLLLHSFALDRGRPSDVRSDLETLASLGPDGLRLSLWLQVQDALYAEGDTVAAKLAIEKLQRPLQIVQAGGTTQQQRRHATNLFWLEQWRIAHGDSRSVRQAITRIRTLQPLLYNDQLVTRLGPAAAVLLEAQLAALEGRPDSGVRLARLDSLLLFGEPMGFEQAVNLAAARLHETRGDLQAALAAVRRRPRATSVGNNLPRATYLREEGRLAALLGDTLGAIYAYRYYLALRSNPEPSVRPEVERVRAALARLEQSNRE